MRKMQYLLMPLEKSSEGTELQRSVTWVSFQVDTQLQTVIHSYTDDILYILWLVRIVTRVSSMPKEELNAWQATKCHNKFGISDSLVTDVKSLEVRG